MLSSCRTFARIYSTLKYLQSGSDAEDHCMLLKYSTSFSRRNDDYLCPYHSESWMWGDCKSLLDMAKAYKLRREAPSRHRVKKTIIFPSSIEVTFKKSTNMPFVTWCLPLSEKTKKNGWVLIYIDFSPEIPHILPWILLKMWSLLESASFQANNACLRIQCNLHSIK